MDIIKKANKDTGSQTGSVTPPDIKWPEFRKNWGFFYSVFVSLIIKCDFNFYENSVLFLFSPSITSEMSFVARFWHAQKESHNFDRVCSFDSNSARRNLSAVFNNTQVIKSSLITVDGLFSYQSDCVTRRTLNSVMIESSFHSAPSASCRDLNSEQTTQRLKLQVQLQWCDCAVRQAS